MNTNSLIREVALTEDLTLNGEDIEVQGLHEALAVTEEDYTEDYVDGVSLLLLMAQERRARREKA